MTEHNDEHLARLYKQSRSGQEQPPADLDATILAAAHKAVASKPRRGSSPFPANWMIPASLAAVLVIVVGVVHLLEQQPGYEVFNGAPELPEPAEPRSTLDQATDELAAVQQLEEQQREKQASEQLEARREQELARMKQERQRKEVARPRAKPAPRQAPTAAPVPAMEPGPAVAETAGEPAVAVSPAPAKQTPADDSRDEETTNFAFRSLFSSPSRVSPAALAQLDAIREQRLAGELQDANRLMDEFVATYIEDKPGAATIKDNLLRFGPESRTRLLEELEALGRHEQAEQYREVFEANPAD